MNITKLKADLAAKGFAMSSGAGWTAADAQKLRDYSYLNHTNVSAVTAQYGLAYESLLPDGFPGKESDDPDVVSIAVTGADTDLEVGDTVQLTATATMSDDSTPDVSSIATWSSDNESAVTVDSTGLATAVGEGDATVSAMVEGVSGSIDISSTEPVVLQSIAVTPNPVDLAASATQQLTATGTYSDASQVVIADSVWDSSDDAVATVDVDGLVTAVAAGTAQISSTKDGVIGTVTVTVSA